MRSCALVVLLWQIALILKYCAAPSSVHGSEVELLIAGGHEAHAGQFPFVAQLLITMHGMGYKCGCAILSSKIVLTAGHCVDDASRRFAGNSTIKVLAGQLSYGIQKSSSTDAQIRAVTRVSIHDDYRTVAGQLRYDLALLLLSSPLTFTANVHPIRLPAQDALFTGDAIALGWGHPAPFGGNLSAVVVPIVFSSRCRETFGNDRFDNQTMICAGGSGKGACPGDSGSPLVCLMEGRSYLCGIASFAAKIPNCEKHPQGFARVAAASDWILAKMEEFTKNPEECKCETGGCTPPCICDCEIKNDSFEQSETVRKSYTFWSYYTVIMLITICILLAGISFCVIALSCEWYKPKYKSGASGARNSVTLTSFKRIDDA